MSQALDQVAYDDLDAQFLAQFTAQALLEGLTRFEFCRREFPQAAEVGVGVPVSDKEFAVTESRAAATSMTGMRVRNR